VNGGAPPVASDVTVMIPTTGRELLRTCLLSLTRGTVWPSEIVVVDQSLRPEVFEWIDEAAASGMRVRHIRSRNTGIAQATNVGLSNVGTSWVAVTHDDCEVATDWMEILVAHTRTADEAVITGRVEPGGDGIVITIKTSRVPARYTRPRLDGDVLFPLNMGFPMHLLQRIGGFDEHPSLRLAGEDNDWAHRALRCGIAIVYDPDMVVSHIAGQKTQDLYPIYRRYAYGQGSFYGKHLRRGDALIALRALRDTVRAPWLLLRGLLSRNASLVAMGRGEITGLVPGILVGLRRGRAD
jgi:GT2 family glycosyltransferase